MSNRRIADLVQDTINAQRTQDHSASGTISGAQYLIPAQVQGNSGLDGQADIPRYPQHYAALGAISDARQGFQAHPGVPQGTPATIAVAGHGPAVDGLSGAQQPPPAHAEGLRRTDSVSVSVESAVAVADVSEPPIPLTLLIADPAFHSRPRLSGKLAAQGLRPGSGNCPFGSVPAPADVSRTPMTVATGPFSIHWREKVAFGSVFREITSDHDRYAVFTADTRSWCPVVARASDGRVGNLVPRDDTRQITEFVPVEPAVSAERRVLGGISRQRVWRFSLLQTSEQHRATERKLVTPGTSKDELHPSYQSRWKIWRSGLVEKREIQTQVAHAFETAVKVQEEHDMWNFDSALRRARSPEAALLLPAGVEEPARIIDVFLLHHTHGPEPRLTPRQRQRYESIRTSAARARRHARLH